ncbi:helix-turn-helix domain-containing protein [Pseudomonas japonica]|uniref:helix-turn-helix domain-containing protein n=1 Tax=Pseudomonas japonica TaxID=256466 RepID=UPI0015E3D560|nr:helix-turn-helix transcriptional regulator [Pseudomonas japonica]
MGIGDRLREERERLGLNQTDFAARFGVSKNTQYNYEKGERSPDAVYLCAVQNAGVDALYILLGKRASVTADSLTAIESEIVDYLRRMSAYNVESVRRMAYALAGQDGGLNTPKQ